VEEPSAIRTEFARTTQPADDEFISRQSTMEERVIDRYVIETHPEEDGGEQHTEEQEAEEQEAEEEPVTTSVSYDVSGDEQQFRQALAGGLDEFRTELINRTLEHDASASGNDPAVLQTGTRPRKLTNATLAIISEPSKMRMSSSKTPPPSPLEADADETQDSAGSEEADEPEAAPSQRQEPAAAAAAAVSPLPSTGNAKHHSLISMHHTAAHYSHPAMLI